MNFSTKYARVMHQADSLYPWVSTAITLLGTACGPIDLSPLAPSSHEHPRSTNRQPPVQAVEAATKKSQGAASDAGAAAKKADGAAARAEAAAGKAGEAAGRAEAAAERAERAAAKAEAMFEKSMKK